jgi:hypothetical protein
MRLHFNKFLCAHTVAQATNMQPGGAHSTCTIFLPLSCLTHAAEFSCHIVVDMCTGMGTAPQHGVHITVCREGSGCHKPLPVITLAVITLAPMNIICNVGATDATQT